MACQRTWNQCAWSEHLSGWCARYQSTRCLCKDQVRRNLERFQRTALQHVGQKMFRFVALEHPGDQKQKHLERTIQRLRGQHLLEHANHMPDESSSNLEESGLPPLEHRFHRRPQRTHLELARSSSELRKLAPVEALDFVNKLQVQRQVLARPFLAPAWPIVVPRWKGEVSKMRNHTCFTGTLTPKMRHLRKARGHRDGRTSAFCPATGSVPSIVVA